jgi:hypothetical protein
MEGNEEFLSLENIVAFKPFMMIWIQWLQMEQIPKEIKCNKSRDSETI